MILKGGLIGKFCLNLDFLDLSFPVKDFLDIVQSKRSIKSKKSKFRQEPHKRTNSPQVFLPYNVLLPNGAYLLTETELVLRLREGNEDAFRELVQAYGDRVYNTVLGIVQQAEDAEEIAQDVFIRVHLAIGSFEGNSALSTWIYRIAVNRSLDHLRSRKRQKRFGFISNIFNGNNGSLHDPADFHHPGAALDQKEKTAILFKAIKKLPENQQSAFILNKTEGLSYNEIAAIMNISEAAVDALLQRAKQNLRKLIDKKNM